MDSERVTLKTAHCIKFYNTTQMASSTQSLQGMSIYGLIDFQRLFFSEKDWFALHWKEERMAFYVTIIKVFKPFVFYEFYFSLLWLCGECIRLGTLGL